MLAAMCAAFGEPMDELRLSDDDAHRLAARIVDVEKHYKLPAIPADKLALGMLAVTVFRVYTPKATAIYARKMAAPAAPAQRHPEEPVVTFRPEEMAPDAPAAPVDWFAASDGTGIH